MPLDLESGSCTDNSQKSNNSRPVGKKISIDSISKFEESKNSPHYVYKTRTG